MKICAILTICFFLSTSSSAKEPSEKTDVLSLQLYQRVSPNNSPELFEYFPIPLLFFSHSIENSPLSLSLITAGIYNRLSIDRSFEANWFAYSAVSTFFHFAGDRVLIDGEDFEEFFDFNGHLVGAEVGAGKNFSVYDFLFRSSLSYEVNYRYFYDHPNTTAFTTPSPFFEHGPSLRVHRAKLPPSEMFERGWFPKVSTSFLMRENDNSWGVSLFRRKPSSYFKLGVDSRLSLPLSRDWVLYNETVAAYVSNGDRLNAARDGSVFGNQKGVFLKKVKSDRSIKTEFGPRIYLFPRNKLALRPFIFGAYYREIVVQEFRNQVAYGGGLKFFGSIGRSLLWDFTYGASHGVNESKDLIHEVQTSLSFSFL